MLKRTITGAFITVIMGAVLYFSYVPAIMTGTCIVLSAFSVYEICRASGKVNSDAFDCFFVAGHGAIFLGDAVLFTGFESHLHCCARWLCCSDAASKTLLP